MEKEINGPESEKWDEIEYYDVDPTQEGTKIGGFPTYALIKETIMWPFGKTSGEKGIALPLKFLNQIRQEDGADLYVFVGSANDNLAGGIDDPFYGDTAVYNSKTDNWPKWVETREIKRSDITSDMLWSPAHAISHSGYTPKEPYWLQDINDTPKDYPIFIYQVPEYACGLPLPRELNTYIFGNDEGDAVAFVIYF